MTYDSVQKFNSVENYILQMRPILRKRALFSDGTADYRMPPEPKAGEGLGCCGVWCGWGGGW